MRIFARRTAPPGECVWGIRSPQPLPLRMPTVVTHCPHVCGHGLEIGTRELCAALGRHRAPVALGVRYPVRNRPRNRVETAISPEPFAAREVRCERRAFGVRTVAACTCSAVGLAMEYTLAERDLRGRGAGRHWQGSHNGFGAGIRMDAFR